MFFHTGLFAYDGLGAFWMPFFVFFGWMVAITVTTFQAIDRHQQKLEAEAALVAA